MGKRELLLVLAFVIIGAVVYQATAPPSGPDDRGLSISGLLDRMRREIGANRASAETTTSTTIPADPTIAEVRIIDYLSEIRVTGEDRRDIDASLQVHSRAYDEAEAGRTAAATVLETDRAADSVVLKVDYPREGRQRAALTLKVPAGLRVRIESRPDTLEIANVAGVELTNSGGRTTLRDVSGRVSASVRGGAATMTGVGSLKLTARSSEVTVAGVRGEASMSLEAGGRLNASRVAGAVDVDARNAEIEIHEMESSGGPIRINAVNGRVRVGGIRSDARVDGRNCEIEVAMAAPAPAAIYSVGGNVALTPPPRGYHLDAVVTEGRIVPEALIAEMGLQHSIDRASGEARAAGDRHGGGPVVTVRVTRGDLTLVPQPGGPPDTSRGAKD